MKKETALEWICYAFIILFLYTAFSKLFLFTVYLDDLHRSPLLAPFANYLSILLPLSEIAVAVALFLPQYRKIGLYGAAALMVMFTGYVTYVLTLTTKRPCTCGGLIRQLTWPQHLVFNIFFTALALVGIYLYNKAQRYSNFHKTARP